MIGLNEYLWNYCIFKFSMLQQHFCATNTVDTEQIFIKVKPIWKLVNSSCIDL